MPTIAYECQACDHAFTRVFLRGEEPHKIPCPKCSRGFAVPSRSSDSLFDGISSFSSLARDTN